MHELSVCQSIITQIEQIARQNHAIRVNRITVAIGPLAGIEASLLQHAFTIARSGTVAGDATLNIQSLPLKVYCNQCQQESEVNPNKLICPLCNNWQTRITSGDEMLITQVELDSEEDMAHV